MEIRVAQDAGKPAVVQMGDILVMTPASLALLFEEQKRAGYRDGFADGLRDYARVQGEAPKVEAS